MNAYYIVKRKYHITNSPNIQSSMKIVRFKKIPIISPLRDVGLSLAFNIPTIVSHIVKSATEKSISGDLQLNLDITLH